MTSAPATVPMASATCCFHGVASTSWPVFRSCRLSLATVAAAMMTEVTNSVNATSAGPALAGSIGLTPSATSSAAEMTTMMPTPDSGLLLEPIRPAM